MEEFISLFLIFHEHKKTVSADISAIKQNPEKQAYREDGVPKEGEVTVHDPYTPLVRV